MKASPEQKLMGDLAACHGNIADLGKRMGISRQAANVKVRQAGLEGYAARLRDQAGVPGRRTTNRITDEDERRRIMGALTKSNGNESAAALALGIKRDRLRRSRARLGI